MGVLKELLYCLSSKKWICLFKDQTIFPYYHIVKDEKIPHIKNLYSYKNKKQFTADLLFLKENYIPMSPKDLEIKKDSKNHFLLSFDDGLKEVYSEIYPVLKQMGIRAIFFINPTFIDNQNGFYKHYISLIISHLEDNNFICEHLKFISEHFSFSYRNNDDFKRKFLKIDFAKKDNIITVFEYLGINHIDFLNSESPYLTKIQIQEMINDGFCFGGHTMSHPKLERLTIEEQKKEIINSMEWLKENFNIDYSFFAFPFSDKKISKKLMKELFDYDDKIFLFGNSGLKKDFDNRVIQRFSIEDPNKKIGKLLVSENLYKYFNVLIGKYKIKRA